MMTDTARFAHAAPGDDDRSAGKSVDRLTLLHRLREMEVRRQEGGLSQMMKILKPARMTAIDGRCANRERRVEEHRHLRQLAAMDQPGKIHKQFLRSLHCKRRDQQHSLSRKGVPNFIQKNSA